MPSVGAISAVPKVVVPSVSGGSGSGSTGGGGGGGLVAAMSGAAGASGTSYSTALTQSAAIRRAELASGSTINVTVNGAIDSEGTARTIVNTLNDSFYRGTGGGGNLQLVN